MIAMPQNPPPSFLVVDDSKVSRTLVTGLLRNRMPEASFREAGDGETAVAMFEDDPASIVVMDFNMPGIHGVEAAQRMRALRSEVPIVLLTANGQSAVQSKADAAGIHFMRKPIKAELADQIVALARPAA
jgi:CheY-like chemotaxis protein